MLCSILAALAAQALQFASAANAKPSTSTSTTTSTYTSTTTIYLSYRPAAKTAATQQLDSTSLPSGMPASGPYSANKFRSAVLNSTNHFRAQHLANPLQWDENLATYAQKYASKCIWEHSGGPYGENLAENFQTPTLAVYAWAAEEEKYRYPNEGFSEETGHYTQLVWQNTTHVGCGAVSCDNKAANGANGWFVVCEYFPPGNVEGWYVFNVQKPGESTDGKLGFGVMSSAAASKDYHRLLAPLAIAALLVATCL